MVDAAKANEVRHQEAYRIISLEVWCSTHHKGALIMRFSCDARDSVQPSVGTYCHPTTYDGRRMYMQNQKSSGNAGKCVERLGSTGINKPVRLRLSVLVALIFWH
jgi:hypothetical protein